VLLNVSSWAIADTFDFCDIHGAAPVDGLTKPVVQFTRKSNVLPFSGHILFRLAVSQCVQEIKSFNFFLFHVTSSLEGGVDRVTMGWCLKIALSVGISFSLYPV
jgi:hypothetical protein